MEHVVRLVRERARDRQRPVRLPPREFFLGERESAFEDGLVAGFCHVRVEHLQIYMRMLVFVLLSWVVVGVLTWMKRGG